MERSDKMVLVVALALTSFAVCLVEGRDIQSKPKPYKPQNFFGIGGITGPPGLGGSSGLVPGGFGFGRPVFGSVPIIGVPVTPGVGLRAQHREMDTDAVKRLAKGLYAQKKRNGKALDESRNEQSDLFMAVGPPHACPPQESESLGGGGAEGPGRPSG
ncbi:hypothetical protein COCNU_12G000510 [Cocos nucifera]|uniref:Uncharacterized protein n=1 Tax=Cocos nucifera TaxID=13894 RepID=A0A8K0IR42_COCNU|nr:hypothetical protein COCNU_12G000510 [Cocos nucifera]